MKRGPLVIAGAAAIALCGGVVALVAADDLLDDRKRELLATGCAKPIDVPGAAVLLNSLGAGLLIGTAVLLVALIVLLARTASRWKAPTILVAGIVLVAVGLYAALVTFATVSPGSTEPSSPEYHPCAARI